MRYSSNGDRIVFTSRPMQRVPNVLEYPKKIREKEEETLEIINSHLICKRESSRKFQKWR